MTSLLLLVGLVGAAPLNPELTASYYGEALLHPGLTLGLQAPVFTVERQRPRPALWAGVRRELLLGAELGGFVHPRTRTLTFVRAEATWRKTRPKGLMRDTGAGLGYSRSLLNSPTWSLDASGEPQRAWAAGQGLVLGSAFAGVGWDHGRDGGPPVTWSVRSELSLGAPYNAGVALGYALELHVSTPLPRRSP